MAAGGKHALHDLDGAKRRPALIDIHLWHSDDG